MTRQLSKTTMLILAESSKMSNRQVADKLKLDIDTVRHARHRHGVAHGGYKRHRGIAESIMAHYGCKDAEMVAKAVGCSKGYVHRVWREIGSAH